MENQSAPALLAAGLILLTAVPSFAQAPGQATSPKFSLGGMIAGTAQMS